MATASDVLKVASAEVGQTNGAKYWRFVFPSYKYVNGSLTPYCASFVSWVADKCGQKVDGLPGGYCPYILNAWKRSGRMVEPKNAKAGDLVCFDWQGDGISDHIGIVEDNKNGVLHTIEGNTNGGKVARRTRAYKTCAGIYRPNYSKHQSETEKEMAIIKEDLENIAFNVWHYKNKKLEKGDAYQILRDIRDDVNDIKARVAAIEKKLK